MSDETPVSCSKCSTVWQKCGTTNCWSDDPLTAPPRPGNCPSEKYADVVAGSIEEYRGDSEDARIAFVAARVEGLCYQPVPGSDAVNARWTRGGGYDRLCKTDGLQEDRPGHLHRLAG